MNTINIKYIQAIMKIVMISLESFSVYLLHKLRAYRGDIREHDQAEPGAKITAILEVLIVGLTA